MSGMTDSRLGTIAMTARGKERLGAELRRLTDIERPQVLKALAEAQARGELMENVEYAAARERQAAIEARIAELEIKLASAQIIDPRQLGGEGRCVFGATVAVVEPASGSEATYQLVGDDEADIKEGRISVSSPLGRALIGKQAGEEVDVQAPGGVKRYEILEVRYE